MESSDAQTPEILEFIMKMNQNTAEIAKVGDGLDLLEKPIVKNLEERPGFDDKAEGACTDENELLVDLTTSEASNLIELPAIRSANLNRVEFHHNEVSKVLTGAAVEQALDINIEGACADVCDEREGSDESIEIAKAAVREFENLVELDIREAQQTEQNLIYFDVEDRKECYELGGKNDKNFEYLDHYLDDDFEGDGCTSIMNSGFSGNIRPSNAKNMNVKLVDISEGVEPESENGDPENFSLDFIIGGTVGESGLNLRNEEKNVVPAITYNFEEGELDEKSFAKKAVREFENIGIQPDCIVTPLENLICFDDEEILSYDHFEKVEDKDADLDNEVHGNGIKDARFSDNASPDESIEAVLEAKNESPIISTDHCEKSETLRVKLIFKGSFTENYNAILENLCKLSEVCLVKKDPNIASSEDQSGNNPIIVNEGKYLEREAPEDINEHSEVDVVTFDYNVAGDSLDIYKWFARPWMLGKCLLWLNYLGYLKRTLLCLIRYLEVLYMFQILYMLDKPWEKVSEYEEVFKVKHKFYDENQQPNVAFVEKLTGESKYSKHEHTRSALVYYREANQYKPLDVCEVVQSHLQFPDVIQVEFNYKSQSLRREITVYASMLLEFMFTLNSIHIDLEDGMLEDPVLEEGVFED